MSKKNTPEKTLQRTLVFVALFIEFLGISIFAGINVLAVHQKNQDFSQAEAEEKFSRLPEYFSNRRSSSSYAQLLGSVKLNSILQFKEEKVYDLLLLFGKDPRFYDPEDCSTDKALVKLKEKKSVPQLIASIQEDLIINHDAFCLVTALRVLKSKEEIIPHLVKLTEDSNYYTRCNAVYLLGQIQLKEISNSIALRETEVIPRLVELLQNQNSHVRGNAAHVLGQLQAKQVIPKLISMLDNSNGIEQYRVLESLVMLDGLNEFQIKKWMVEIIKELESPDMFSTPGKKSLAIDISIQIYLRFHQEFKESETKLLSIDQSRRIRDSQWILTGSALAAFLLLLMLTLFSFRELQKIIWQDHLICYFPEEVVGELTALRHELIQAKKSTLLVEITLIHVIFTLIWAFYIQINIDNLWLPSKDQRRR
jgi:hypothetical protein